MKRKGKPPHGGRFSMSIGRRFRSGNKEKVALKA
jgi:hypothetical protein